MTRHQIRQGDVLLVPVEFIPANAKAEKRRGSEPLLLAYGETTGHAHGVYGPATMYRADEGVGAATYIMAERGAQLGHGTPTDGAALPDDPDHGPIALDGAYRVVRQVEYPRASPARRVAD